jgi:hypothetical protein
MTASLRTPNKEVYGLFQSMVVEWFEKSIDEYHIACCSTLSPVVM